MKPSLLLAPVLTFVVAGCAAKDDDAAYASGSRLAALEWRAEDGNTAF